MTDDLREQDVADADFFEAVVRYLDGQLSTAELPAFEARLAADADARQILLDICLQMAAIAESPAECLMGAEEVVSGQPSVDRKERSGVRGQGPGKAASESDPRSQIFDVESLDSSLYAASEPPAYIVLDDSQSSLVSGPSPLWMSHPFLFSNLFSLLVIGIGALGAWFYQIDIPNPLAHKDRQAAATKQLASRDQREFVGQVSGMADVEWADAQTATVYGARVPLGRKYDLSSGLMEISYDSGAKVILQGPVVYEVDSRDGGFLAVGKLTARLEKRGEGRGESRGKVASGRNLVASGRNLVASEERSGVRGQGAGKVASGQWSVASETNPKSQIDKSQIDKSQISNPLLSPVPRSQSPVPMFAVRTPTAMVTDLGTEFGVEVTKEGTTMSHVFRGTIQVQRISAEGKAEGEAQVLHENQTARVESNPGKNQSSPSIVVLNDNGPKSDFIRKIPRTAASCSTVKRVDLVDVVAGGNGFGGRRNAGIDLTNGELLPELPKPALSADEYKKGDGKYHRVRALSMVDGVFIPDGSKGPVQTDSAGNTFEWFPETSNVTDGGIWVGGVIHADPPFQDIPATVGGIDYSSAGHGALYLHSNRGITFNLDAIRQANPGYQIRCFRAVAGNTEVLSEKNGGSAMADFWVLVDGKARYRRRQINAMSGDFPIEIPIAEKDRFLTLASTDGGDGIMWDWILFGDPKLEMQSTAGERPVSSRPK